MGQFWATGQVAQTAGDSVEIALMRLEMLYIIHKLAKLAPGLGDLPVVRQFQFLQIW